MRDRHIPPVVLWHSPPTKSNFPSSLAFSCRGSAHFVQYLPFCPHSVPPRRGATGSATEGVREIAGAVAYVYHFLETSRIMGLPCTLYEITERTLAFFFLLFTFCFLSFAKEEMLKRTNCIPQCLDGRTASSTKSSASKAASACRVPSQESDPRSMPLGTTLLMVTPALSSLSFG